MNNPVIYILEDLWFSKWKFISEDADREFLENHAQNLRIRLAKTDPSFKFEYRIREKTDKDINHYAI